MDVKLTDVERERMDLWLSVCTTDREFTKAFQGKAIDAQYQRMQATRVFGPMGLGWGVVKPEFEVVHFDPNDPHYDRYMYKAILWYDIDGEKGEIPIHADIEMWQYSRKWKSWEPTTDIRKKVVTDALTKGLSNLGFSADVFLGLYDGAKHLTFSEESGDQIPEPAEIQPAAGTVPDEAPQAGEVAGAPGAQEAVEEVQQDHAEDAPVEPQGRREDEPQNPVEDPVGKTPETVEFIQLLNRQEIPNATKVSAMKAVRANPACRPEQIAILKKSIKEAGRE